MKKLSLIALSILFSMFFLVSCADDEEEDAVDTVSGDTQADTGADTGTDTGADTGSDTTDTGVDTGSDTTDTGTDTGADTGSDTTDTATDTGADTGSDTTDTGTDTGADTGSDTTDTGTDTGADTGSDTTDTGADTGDTGDTGTGSDGNLNTGDTSGNQAQSGNIGAACTNDNQCKQTYGSGDDEQIASCLFESDGFPGGYCSFLTLGYEEGACNSTGEVFYNFGNSPDSISSSGNGLCLHRCTKPSDCRKGYRCSNKIHACLPNCKIEGYECFHGVCDQTEGVCLKY